jgi:uncharacterized protein (TIGR03067 family)
MKVVVLTCVLAAGLALAVRAGQDPDAAKLEGTWSLVSVEIEGRALPMENLKQARLTVKGERYSFRLGDTRLEIIFKMESRKTPREIDLKVVEGPEKGKTFHGIYTLENGRYRICRSIRPHEPRPTAFATSPESGLMMVVWKREPVSR